MSRDRVELLFRNATNALYAEDEPVEDKAEPAAVAGEEEYPEDDGPLYGSDDEEDDAPFEER
jgi:hypothetical protein